MSKAMETNTNGFAEFLAKIEEFKGRSGADITASEDLSLAVMNLVSLEEHFFFTGMKTGKDEYFDTAAEIREMRKELLAKLMPENEGETWCISKHLLATSMRLVEVGNRYQAEGKKDEARGYFEKAYKAYSIFWALKLKLVDAKAAPADPDKKPTLESIVSALADCCKE